MKELFFGDTLFFTELRKICVRWNGGWLNLGGQYEKMPFYRKKLQSVALGNYQWILFDDLTGNPGRIAGCIFLPGVYTDKSTGIIKPICNVEELTL